MAHPVPAKPGHARDPGVRRARAGGAGRLSLNTVGELLCLHRFVAHGLDADMLLLHQCGTCYDKLFPRLWEIDLMRSKPLLWSRDFDFKSSDEGFSLEEFP